MRNSPVNHRSPLLSVTAEYALRAVLVLARNAGRALRADEVAVAIGAPRNYLAKTLNSLAKAGIVTSARGPLGGFTLAAAADTLTVADIAAVFNPSPPPGMCLLRDRLCDPSNPCSAHARWSGVSQSARDAMTTTIAALLGGHHSEERSV
jgi:Rrf2 family transcriptional regulator, iron-sulfur cluster assembly transcription factor